MHFLYVASFCFIAHWSLILFFFPLVRALLYAYSTSTAIFNSFLFAVCVILVETLDFKLQKINCTFFTKASYLYFSTSINFLPPQGTPLMFNLATYRFSHCSLKRFILLAWQKLVFALCIKSFITPRMLIRFTSNLIQVFGFRPQYIFQISARLEHTYVLLISM